MAPSLVLLPMEFLLPVARISSLQAITSGIESMWVVFTEHYYPDQHGVRESAQVLILGETCGGKRRRRRRSVAVDCMERCIAMAWVMLGL
jgi:hypothetical protein